VKLSGWIKSAVAFIKKPTSPREIVSQPDAPPEIESSTVAEDVSSDAGIEIRPERPFSVEPESPISVEPESPIGVEPERPIGSEAKGSPNQQEIDRRRAIVRKFFNDYWASVDDKPASFAARLDGAEGYINERVAAGGEAWQLDPATRKQLGLPPSRKKA
jgi:hypothetical protein